MKKVVPPKQKKGAVELSMTTIIVVVLGITILTLGLRWVYNIFGGLEDQRGKLIEATEEQIRETFGDSSDPLNLLSSSVSIEKDNFKDIGVGIKNTYSGPHTFAYTVVASEYPASTTAEATLAWISWDKGVISLTSGQLFSDTLSLDPKTAPLGLYKLRLTLNCLDCITEETFTTPLTVRVVTK